ncbi:hypothetical protein H6F96_31735 [Microcoleus sp. FACHB-53]|nr:hypothetical protein [Microcoleus sp. FACHB-53]
MVAIAEKVQRRLTMQTVEIAPGTTAIRSLDWDRDRFDCDAFGLHYCDDHTFDEDLELIEEDYKYYYDCLMGPDEALPQALPSR